MVCEQAALFRGRQFTDEIIVPCVRWYLRYSLSYRDLTEMNEQIRRELKPTNGSWRTDETYVRVAGAGPIYIGC